jgi:glycosyltransferase involved in cell wall biosynthesis
VYETAAVNLSPAPPSVVLASGPPFYNFVAGLWIAKLFRAHLVLDYRDEWTESPQGFNQNDSTNRRWERKCLAFADRVIFTTESQLEHQDHHFSPELSREKCSVVYNGWEPEDFPELPDESANSSRRNRQSIILSFFGNLGPWYDPESFLNTLLSAYSLQPDLPDRLDLRFYGHRPPVIDKLLDNFSAKLRFSLYDNLPKADACRLMQNADGLLLLNPPAYNRYISGKTYEYVASRTPILLYGQGGEMSSIVNALSTGFVVPANDPAALAEAIYGLPSFSPPPTEDRERWLQSRTRRMQAQLLFSSFAEPSSTI